MESTLVSINLSITSGVELECPNCKVVNTFSKYIYDKGYFIIFVARVVGFC